MHQNKIAQKTTEVKSNQSSGVGFIVVHRDGAPQGVNLAHVRLITTWPGRCPDKQFTRLVFSTTSTSPTMTRGNFRSLLTSR
jgi:hypothetical protein